MIGQSERTEKTRLVRLPSRSDRVCRRYSNHRRTAHAWKVPVPAALIGHSDRVNDGGDNTPYPLLVQDHVSARIGVTTVLGRLLVSSDELRFEPVVPRTKLNTEPAPTVSHTDHAVTVVHGSFAPPWMNSGLVLTDKGTLGRSTAVVGLAGWDRRKIAATLRAAGFDVEEYRTVWSVGGRIGTVRALERFRKDRSPE